MTRPRLLAIAWTLGILAACSIPGHDFPSVDVSSVDKAAHFVMFAVFGWLWLRALHGPMYRRMGRVLVAGLAYAVLTEVYQGLLPFERSPDPLDALANALGLLAATLLYRLVEGRAET